MEVVLWILRVLVGDLDPYCAAAMIDRWRCTLPRNRAQARFEKIVLECTSDEEVFQRLEAKFFGFFKVTIWHLSDQTIVTMKDHCCPEWRHAITLTY